MPSIRECVSGVEGEGVECTEKCMKWAIFINDYGRKKLYLSYLNTIIIIPTYLFMFFDLYAFLLNVENIDLQMVNSHF